MKTVILWGVLLFTATTGYCQTATDSIKGTIDGLFTAMRQSDSASIIRCFASDAVLQTIVDKPEGTSVRTEQVAEFAAAVNRFPKEACDERIVYDVIKVDGNLAVVWTPYRFYYKKEFRHCGVNSFQLVRLQGSWKIQYIIDTRHKMGCAAD